MHFAAPAPAGPAAESRRASRALPFSVPPLPPLPPAAAVLSESMRGVRRSESEESLAPAERREDIASPVGTSGEAACAHGMAVRDGPCWTCCLLSPAGTEDIGPSFTDDTLGRGRGTSLGSPLTADAAPNSVPWTLPRNFSSRRSIGDDWDPLPRPASAANPHTPPTPAKVEQDRLILEQLLDIRYPSDDRFPPSFPDLRGFWMPPTLDRGGGGWSPGADARAVRYAMPWMP